jgi:hypothetical protein
VHESSPSSSSLQARSNCGRVRLIGTNKGKLERGRLYICGFTVVSANPARYTSQVVHLGTHLAPSPPSTSNTMAVGKVGPTMFRGCSRSHISLRTSVCQKERKESRKRSLTHSLERVRLSRFILRPRALLILRTRVV